MPRRSSAGKNERKFPPLRSRPAHVCIRRAGDDGSFAPRNIQPRHDRSFSALGTNHRGRMWPALLSGRRWPCLSPPVAARNHSHLQYHRPYQPGCSLAPATGPDQEAGHGLCTSRGICPGSSVSRRRSEGLQASVYGVEAIVEWRSVRPSAQPTLIRTQHPPQAFPQLLLGKLSRPQQGRAAIERSTEPLCQLAVASGGPFAQVSRAYHAKRGWKRLRMNHARSSYRRRIRNWRDVCGMDLGRDGALARNFK